MSEGLPVRWREHFPTTLEEAKKWQRYTARYALASKVLTVATTRIDGTWKAYCDAVPGEDHHAEKGEVLRHGDPLREKVARALFPEFEEVPYAD